jgi:crotonobetainyl-CoA:carnitine CoA-transferase CaiB-like acyl-CoA transferase
MCNVALLEGLNVLDMSSVITGPSAAAMLADLGASVIKIEPPGGGDPFRSWESSGERIRPSFAAFNRGKRSIVLDVKDPEGREIYASFAKNADVVIENYRPGRMDKLGIGWKDLHRINPKLVYCHITGRGSTGPDANQPTYDSVAQALSGLWSQFTDLSNPEPVGPPMSDQLTAMYACIAILAGVQNCGRTGSGSLVEVDMLSASLAFSALGVASTTWSGAVPTKTSRARNSQSYAFVAGDGLPFAVHLSTPHKFWVGLCTTIERVDLIDDTRFKTKALRIENYDILKEVLGGIFSGGTRDLWLDSLIGADVPAAPILTVAEAIETPQVLAKQLIAMDAPGAGRGLVRSPIMVDGGHCAAELPPPLLGEHTEALLSELGKDAKQIRSLRQSGTVA